MEDRKLLDRRDRFQNSNLFFKKAQINILETRENFKLSLRKEKLDNLFLSKRSKFLSESDIEIDQEKLNLPKMILDKKYASLEDLLSSLETYISSTSEDVIKYGILSLRKILSSTEKAPISQIMEKGMFDKLVKLLEKYEKENNLVVIILVLFSMKFYGVLSILYLLLIMYTQTIT